MAFRGSSVASSILCLILLLASWLPGAAALRKFESNDLQSCMDNSKFSVSLFNVVFTPNNYTLATKVEGESQIDGYVVLEFEVTGYGYSIIKKTLDPCKEKALKGLCPMLAGKIDLPPFNSPLPAEQINQVPGAIYYVPDIDAKVKVWIKTYDGTPLACVEAYLSNGQTVDQKGVAWSVAVIAILGLLIAAVMSGLGHSNTATHVASYALSLFSYFQALAFIGMAAVTTPPIVRGWTQNFQWSMGIIHVGFLQTMATWYQRATGGTPALLLSSLSTTSVHIQKRGIAATTELMRRSGSTALNDVSVKGIERVGFLAGIERSNIFFTSYTFFIIFVLFVTLGVVLFKYACESFIRSGSLKPDRFLEFRSRWTVVLKGILYRVILIAFPQMVVLCLWELTQRDSAAEVILAVTTFLTVVGIMAWGSWKVFSIAKKSIQLYQNPAYVLYSHPAVLNKWGFLYVQFKAPMYWFIVPLLAVVFLKGVFIALAQGSGIAQAIALVILELGLLIALSIMKPYMDKKTNSFNIAIASVNFYNVVLLLFFTGIFGVPPLAIGIMGVLFFLVNVVFALVILLMSLWASIRAVISKDPDTRYQPMRDDRGSFIKSQTHLGGASTTELDALGAAARGDSIRGTPTPFDRDPKQMTVEEESDDGRSSDLTPIRNQEQNPFAGGYHNRPPPRSPMANSPPVMRPHMNQAFNNGYGPANGGYAPANNGYNQSTGGFQTHNNGFAPVYRTQSPLYTPASPMRPSSPLRHGQTPQRTASPWQRGVGY